MSKWLAAGAAVLVIIVLLLWLQIREDAAPVASAPRPVASATPAMQSVTVKAADTQLAKADPVKQDLDLAPEAPTVPPGKIDPRSDAFFNKFDEQVPRRLTREAAKCYEGRHGSLHRNQKLSLMFKTKIVNGTVTVHDVKIKENTISDSALETCFIQQIQRVSWKDDELPDWEQDDQLVIRPERGMRKYWSELESEVGPEGPKW